VFSHTRAALGRFASELRDTLPDLVVSVRAFGSRVRGDHRGDSDMDILVIVRRRTVEVERVIIDLCVEHERHSGVSLDPVIKDETTFERERRHHSPFFENVSRESIAL
jgi:predicted nucleotidyltransferase